MGCQLSTIIPALPEKRQSLLFTATNSSSIEDKHTVAELDQRFLLTPPEARDAYLVQLVLSTREKQSKHSIIIFCKTCRTTELVGLLMTKVGVGSSVLHSMRAQKERTSSLAAFKSGQT